LPAGQLPGSYEVRYTAIVDADATGSVGNVVVASNPPGGDPDPVCTTCSTEHPIEAVVVVVRKDANPAPGSEVRAGDVVTYTLTAEVRNSVTTEVLTLVDTLGEGLAFGEVVDAGAFACTGTLECTLPVGTLPGTYRLSYTALVEADASGELRNVVVATGGSVGTPPECATCSTTHMLAQPRVSIAKSSNPGSGAEVAVGDTIEYTLEVLVEDAATRADVTLVDTPDAGLAIGTLPAECSLAGDTIRCVLPVGTVPGRYTFVYPATVTADAASSIANVVVGESTGGTAPECTSCATTHELADEAALRITKVVGARDARIGDLVRYTLTVENVGTLNVRDGTVLDTPPTGFTYVEDSMTVADGDGAFDLGATRHPLRIGGLDIVVGQRATITYLLRVGAGVRTGVHVNTAVALNGSGETVSNTATAQLVIESDPMLDDSLVFGTVFDDRDGDGWQDSARLGDIRVQGGFEPAAYVPGSTTIDRGHGPEPVADASAPLLAGLALGDLAARESVGQPAPRIVIRQMLREPAFTGDFGLDTAQGVRVRMEADGSTRVETSGDAARGLNAAAPAVTRRVAQVEGGIAVEYVVSSEGVDERGIAGVRIATVEGLLVETDEYGRYHLADIHGGGWVRGRNLVLKVDPATLPPGTAFTTDNPLLRRVTPGLPVRFDFGVKLPVREIGGGRRVLELELGEVVFAPGSAVLREEHLPVVGRIAAKVEEHGGGEVTITASAGDEALAFARATSLRDALQAQVSGSAASALRIGLVTDVDAGAVAGLEGGDTFLGTVLFDTDRAEIRPEFVSLLDAVAKRLDALGGGSVAIVGHTDVRGSHAYNTALGLRRAQAVHAALAERLGPEARARLRVESSADPTAPVGGTW
ncbi:MAG TPA: OmpA family protein, partial [Luteimonas sp.]